MARRDDARFPHPPHPAQPNLSPPPIETCRSALFLPPSLPVDSHPFLRRSSLSIRQHSLTHQLINSPALSILLPLYYSPPHPTPGQPQPCCHILSQPPSPTPPPSHDAHCRTDRPPSCCPSCAEEQLRVISSVLREVCYLAVVGGASLRCVRFIRFGEAEDRNGGWRAI